MREIVSALILQVGGNAMTHDSGRFWAQQCRRGATAEMPGFSRRL
jgi:hypothetical protein